MGNQQPSTNAYIMDKKPKKGFGFIYCYTSPNGKKYVGQTIQSLRQRAKNGRGYQQSSVFLRAIKKYGFKNFLVEILEEAPTELLNEKEIEWIAFLNTVCPNGYNIFSGGEGYSKKIYQYDHITGEFLKEYDSLIDAAQQNNIKNIQPISDCLHKRTKCAHGFIWRLEKADFVDPQDYYSNNPREIYAYHLNGDFYRKFSSIAEAVRYTGANRADIQKALKGKIKFTKNLIWTDKSQEITPIYTGANGRKPVKQIDINTNQVIHIYESQSDAARALGLPRPNGISSCCKGKQKTCAGFRWEFSEGSTTTSPEIPVG